MRLPLLNEAAARAGERESLMTGEPAAKAYLDELAHRLRSDPTPEELGKAAEVLEAVAASGPAGWAAAGFAPAHRPKETARNARIWEAVRELVDSGESPGRARARVARREDLSVSRVKAICLEWDRGQREHDRINREYDPIPRVDIQED